MCVCAQSCLTLCNRMDYSPPGSSIRGIFQAQILKLVVINAITPGHYTNPGIEPVSLRSPALAGGFFTISATWRSQRVNDSPETQLLLSSNHVFMIVAQSQIMTLGSL